MLKIYKITKESDPMSIYIGRTKVDLKVRMIRHLSDKKSNKYKRKICDWIDSNCKISLIEFTYEKIREVQLIQEYIANGYNVLNTYDGKHILNPKDNMQKIHSKHNAKNNANMTKEYKNWLSKYAKRAKKEGLTSKEYKLKYNIPDFSGPKKIN